MPEIFRDCTTCKNAILDMVWGEWKCKVYEHRIYDASEYEDCDSWVKKPKNYKKKGETCYD